MDLYGSNNTLTGSQKYSKLQNAFTLLLSKHSAMRMEQLDALRYAVGKIIDDDTKGRLLQQHRPILEFPIPQQTLLYIAGKLQTDMRKFKAVPTQEGTEMQADLASQRNEWAMEVSKGYDNIARAGMHSAIAKRGVVNIYWDTNTDPEGQPVVRPVDPMMCMFDPDPGQDRFVCYFPMLSCEEIIRIHRKYLDDDTIAQMRRKASEYEARTRDSMTPTSWTERLTSDVRRQWMKWRGLPDNPFTLNEWMDSSSGLYRVVEWHDSRTEIHKFAYSPITGDMEAIPASMNDDQAFHSDILGQEAAPGVPKYPDGIIHEVSVEKVWVSVICPSLLPDRLVMEEPHPIQGRGFQFKKIDCYDWHPDPLLVQSIMDSLEAPTKFYNHEKMSMMALMGRVLNPGVDAMEESIDPRHIDAWQSGADGLIRWFKKTAGMNRPEERKVPEQAFRLSQAMAESSRELVDFLSGVAQSAKGYQESSGESGVLYKTRISQTEVMIAYFFSRMERATHDIFLYLDKTMDVFMKAPRQLSIYGNPEGPRWLWLNTDETNTLADHDFNYVPDVRSLGENQRAEKFITMSTMHDKAAGDPVLGMFLVGQMAHFLDVPDAKKIEQFVMQRLGMMMQVEQQTRDAANVNAKLDVVDKVKQLKEGNQNGKKKPGKVKQAA